MDRPTSLPVLLTSSYFRKYTFCLRRLVPLLEHSQVNRKAEQEELWRTQE
jgi:hypothetical protein